MKGFTLMEVLVAVAVLSSSSIVFGLMVDFFNQQRNLERSQAFAFTCAVNSMEFLVETAPSCSGLVRGTLPCDSASVSVDSIPGVVPLAWAHVQVSSITFRRLVKCAR